MRLLEGRLVFRLLFNNDVVQLIISELRLAD